MSEIGAFCESGEWAILTITLHYEWGEERDGHSQPSENRTVLSGRENEVDLIAEKTDTRVVRSCEANGEWIERKTSGEDVSQNEEEQVVNCVQSPSEEVSAVGKKAGVITRRIDWVQMEKSIEAVVVSDGCCNEEEFGLFDVSEMVNLIELRVGSGCFESAIGLKMSGMGKLERVVIGWNSFVFAFSSVSLELNGV